MDYFPKTYIILDVSQGSEYASESAVQVVL